MKIEVTNDAGKLLGTYKITVADEEATITALHKFLEADLDLDQCTGCHDWFPVEAFGDTYMDSYEQWCAPCLKRIAKLSPVAD